MFNIRDISIRGKLVAMQVFTSLLVLSIFFAVYVYTDIKYYKERKVISVVNLSNAVADNVASSLVFINRETAKEILEQLKTSREIVYAAVLDTSRKIFAEYKINNSDSIFPAAPKMKDNQVLFSDKYLFTYNQIFKGKELIGYIFLQVRLTELEGIKESKYRMATILLLISVAFSILIAVIVQSYISKRLLSLVSTMNEARKTGNYSVPVIDKGRDEIGTLSNEFNNLMQQVQENERRKDEFIGVASHELKTPLTSIKGYLELAEGLDNSHPEKQFIEKARANADKLERLVKDLLDVSKIQSGQLALDIKEFKIDELVNETISSLQITLKTHRIIKENSTEAIVMADRQRIEQVLVNLLLNAVKYSPGEKTVLVSYQANESSCIIQIRDFGIGIPQDEHANVFKRFYRTKNMSVHISGFGLGLYICNDIITRHKGKIWVKNEEKGSSLYFSLPLKNHE